MTPTTPPTTICPSSPAAVRKPVVGSRLLGSPVLWLFLVLLVVDLFISIIKPLRFISIEGLFLKDQDHIGQRVDYLLSPQSNYDVLVLGDSMTGQAAVNADVKAGLVSLDTTARYAYPHCYYFEKLLRDGLRLKANLAVMGEAGGIIAGNQMLLNKVLEHRKPKLVFLFVGPRGFIDDTNPLELYPMQCYMKNRFKLGSSDTSIKGKVESWLSNNWRYYALRSDYATVVRTLVCNVLDRKATLYEVQTDKDGPRHKLKVSFVPSIQQHDPDRKPDEAEIKYVTDFYTSIYGHQSWERWQLNLKSFKSILTDVRKEGIPLIVVSMPLSAGNRQLARQEFLSEYKNTLSSLCCQHGSGFIYMLDDRRFIPADFQDGAHLNGVGAVKFWQLLIGEIQRNSTLSRLIKQAMR